jgi:hypothetical protein
MTTKADYTPEEWAVISRSVANVVFVALMADVSTVEELYQEGNVVYGGLDAKIEANHDNELLLSMDREGDDVPDPTDPAQSLEELKQLAAIVDSKAQPEEAEGFKQFLYELAHDVANAYAEQEGSNVSEKEAAMLKDVRVALGLPAE